MRTVFSSCSRAISECTITRLSPPPAKRQRRWSRYSCSTRTSGRATMHDPTAPRSCSSRWLISTYRARSRPRRAARRSRLRDSARRLRYRRRRRLSERGRERVRNPSVGLLEARVRARRHRPSLSSRRERGGSGDVTLSDGDHFRVFTPYYRRWKDALRRSLAPARIDAPSSLRRGRLPHLADLVDGAPSLDLAAGGETAGGTGAGADVASPGIRQGSVLGEDIRDKL